MQIDIRTYRTVSETTLTFDTISRRLTLDPKRRAESLALLGFAVASISPVTSSVVPPVPSAAVVGRHAGLRLTVVATEKNQEIFRFDPGYPVEFGSPEARDLVLEAIGQAIGAITTPQVENAPEPKLRAKSAA